MAVAHVRARFGHHRFLPDRLQDRPQRQEVRLARSVTGTENLIVSKNHVMLTLLCAGVALLPFVDERRLHAALSEVYPNLNEDEKERNTLGADRLFVGPHHPSHDFLGTSLPLHSHNPASLSPALDIQS